MKELPLWLECLIITAALIVGALMLSTLTGCASIYRAGEQAQFPCVQICDDAVHGLSAARRVDADECACSVLNPWRQGHEPMLNIYFWSEDGIAPRWVPRRLNGCGRRTGTPEHHGAVRAGDETYRYYVQ